MKPGVSIVVTCYNYGSYVAECLDSIKNQTYSNYEVIIVNDGSTDNSEEIIKQYLLDKRFRYIKQENAGQTKAKNRGIKESKAGFIAFLDADDVWRSDKLENQLPLFNDAKVGVVYSRSTLIDNSSNVKDNKSKNEYMKPRRGVVTEWLMYDNFVPFSSSIVKKECLELFGGFDESLSMGIDWDLWLKISTRYNFDYYEKSLLYYRVGHSGQMSKNIQKRINSADDILYRFINKYSERLQNVDIKKALYASYCQRGYALRNISVRNSILYYLKGIKIKPAKSDAYIGIIKSLIKNNAT
jgi:glycosyltransferase involved in cell wall biosynthesis